VHVLAIGRVHGSSFALPNPGLLPTRQELKELYELVDSAIDRLERKGIEADGEVLATRNGAKRIARRAERLRCQAIVMAADPKRNAAVRNFMWSQEPHRVARRSKVPVHLVEVK
jgi:nucleotide-binding universal stress UspA family protein